MAEKVNFTINLDGNLYTGLADIDKELKTVTASATSTLKMYDRIAQYGKDVKIYDKAALERTACVWGKMTLCQKGPKRLSPQLSLLPVKMSLMAEKKNVIKPTKKAIMTIMRIIAPNMTANDINMAFSFLSSLQ